MSRYDHFAQAYDALMGDRADVARQVRSLIRKHHPRAKTLLELGCGTGSILKALSRHYRVTGVDLSSAMLAIAREKVPNVPLLRQDISKLRVSGEFDAVICIFDTMNHLTRFEQWKQVFRRAKNALAPGGVFIFDINTVRKIDLYSSEPPHAEVHRDAICVFDVIRTRGERYRLDLRLLKRTRGKSFTLSEASVPGLAVPTSRIVSALKKEFRSVVLRDTERRKPSTDSEELYFICR